MLEEPLPGRYMLFHMHAREDGSLMYEAWSCSADIQRSRTLCQTTLDFDAVDALFRRAAREGTGRSSDGCLLADVLATLLEQHRAPLGANRLSWVDLFPSASPLEAHPLHGGFGTRI